MNVAQLRYDEGSGSWTLYAADRNDRWFLHDDVSPTRDVGTLLAEVDEDRLQFSGAEPRGRRTPPSQRPSAATIVATRGSTISSARAWLASSGSSPAYTPSRNRGCAW